MEETIIEFKTAKLFKEIGFDIKQNLSYIKETAEVYISAEKTEILEKGSLTYYKSAFVEDKYRQVHSDMYIEAPTQSLAQKYLREKHNIHIVINGTLTDYHPPKKHKSKYEYYYEIFVNFMEDHCKKVSSISNRVLTYEQALEAGLYEAALIVKNKK